MNLLDALTKLLFQMSVLIELSLSLDHLQYLFNFTLGVIFFSLFNVSHY